MTSASERPSNVRELIQNGAQRLRLDGVEQAQIEATVLAGHCLGLTKAALLAHPETAVDDSARQQFAELIERRARGEPLAYLLGVREFYGREFLVDRRALIPRPETELLIDTALAALKHGSDRSLVVDVGTGSGCIAATLAIEAPWARVAAVDISAGALELARDNLRRFGLDQRVRLVRGDLLAWLHGRVGLVVANLPYVPRESLPALPVDVRDYEPRLALDGGPGGAELVLRLLDQASHLDTGHLLAELDPRHAQRVAAAARTRFPDRAVAILPDLAGRDRVLRISPSNV